MSMIDDLLDRWEELRESGQTLLPEQLCVDHPELLPEIRRQIKALEAVSLQFGSQGLDGQSSSEEQVWTPASHFQLLGRFEIIKLHASGGLGHVYLAHDKVLDRPVAIKFLRRAELTDQQLARFEWEAKITGRLEHPGIVPIHSMQDSGDSTPCYVMRFINGQTLQHRVEANLEKDQSQDLAGYLQSDKLRDVLRAFATVCNIVAYAHSQGFIHRDIKPSNIMLGPFDETLLLDWGIAKQYSMDAINLNSALPIALQTVPNDLAQLKLVASIDSPTFTATGQAIGTPAYASPEQLQGMDSASLPSTDIFSLGATLHFILSGKSPIEFFGWSSYLDQFTLADSMLATNLSPRVPRALRAICDKAMHIAPQDRYHSALELAEDIQNFLSRESVSVLPEPWLARVARFARKRPGVSGALVAATTVLMIAILVSSALVDAKNRKLSAATKSLNESLEKTRLANQNAIDSMRSMFDDIVVHHLGQRDVLNHQDRAYLSNLVVQYEKFADQQNIGMQNSAFRAEASYRIGRLYHQLLSADHDPFPHAQRATHLYAILCHADSQVELVDEYLESLRLLSEILIERVKDVDEAIRTVHLCFSERDYFRDQLKADDKWPEVQASLWAILAACRIEKSEWKIAYEYAQKSVSEYEALCESNPSESRFLHKLSAELALLAELAEHPEVESTPESQLNFADRSVALSEKHVKLEPRLALSHIGRGWSYHSRSLANFRMSRFEESTNDIDQAIASIQHLRDRFDSSKFDRSIVDYRTHKLKILYSRERWTEITTEIDQLRKLSLNQFTTGVCIDVLRRYCDLHKEDLIQRVILAEMYLRRGRLQALEGKKEAIEDDLQSIELLAQLTRDNSDEALFRSRLVEALITTAKHQRKLGNLTESDRLCQQATIELSRMQDFNPDLHQKFEQEINEIQQDLAR